MPAASRAPDTGRPGTPLLLVLPLIVLCLALMVACAACAAFIPLRTALVWGLHALPLAGCATLACLVLSLAPAIQGAGPLWLLPLWLAPALGGLGWVLLPPPHTAGSDVARATLLTMPLMMSLLAAAWSRLPAGVLRAAAAAGAPPGTRFWLFLRLRMPGAARACVPVAIVCLALIGPAPGRP